MSLDRYAYTFTVAVNAVSLPFTFEKEAVILKMSDNISAIN